MSESEPFLRRHHKVVVASLSGLVLVVGTVAAADDPDFGPTPIDFDEQFDFDEPNFEIEEIPEFEIEPIPESEFPGPRNVEPINPEDFEFEPPPIEIEPLVPPDSDGSDGTDGDDAGSSGASGSESSATSTTATTAPQPLQPVE